MMKEATAKVNESAFAMASFKNTFWNPKGSLFSNPDIHCKLFPKSASHLKISADDKPHKIYNTQNQ